MQITKADFDNAVKQPWSTHSCILAQLAIRTCGGAGVPQYVIYDAIEELTNWADGLSASTKIMDEFDLRFKLPGDENKPELQKLRASLPITI